MNIVRLLEPRLLGELSLRQGQVKTNLADLVLAHECSPSVLYNYDGIKHVYVSIHSRVYQSLCRVSLVLRWGVRGNRRSCPITKVNGNLCQTFQLGRLARHIGSVSFESASSFTFGGVPPP